MTNTTKDVGWLVAALLTADPDNAPRSPRAVARNVHGNARQFVRWFIVSVALFPVFLAIFSVWTPEIAMAVIPGITLAILVVTVLLFAFRWNQLVAGLVELGIITTLVSKVKKPQALGSLAGAVKDLGTATLRWTSKVIGLELLVGIYFSLVPVANERVLVLVVLMLMATTVFLTLGKARWLAWIPITLLAMATFAFFAGGIDEAVAKYEDSQASAQTTSVAEQAPAQTAGLLIVHRSTEDDICRFAEGEDYKEVLLENVGDKCLVRVPLDARHVRIDSVPPGTPYELCFRDERRGIDLGCYVDEPDDQNTLRLGQEGDFDDLDELSLTLVAMEPMTTIGIRIWP